MCSSSSSAPCIIDDEDDDVEEEDEGGLPATAAVAATLVLAFISPPWSWRHELNIPIRRNNGLTLNCLV